MAAIQPRLAAADPWSIQIRGESFYLTAVHRKEAAPTLLDSGAWKVRPGRLLLPFAQLAPFAAALDQAAGHRAFLDQAHPEPVDPWSVTDHSGGQVIEGPWVELFVSPWHEDEPGMVQTWSEITYADLPGLRRVLVLP